MTTPFTPEDAERAAADIDRIVANETAINFDGRDLLAEVERLQEELNFFHKHPTWRKINQLQEERDDALSRVKEMHRSLRAESKRTEKAFQERDRLADALRYYARRDTSIDGGHRARKALSSLPDREGRKHTQECDDHRFIFHASTGDDANCICGLPVREDANLYAHGHDAIDEPPVREDG